MMYQALDRIQNSRRAAIYVRISEDREGARLGVERQAEDCHALAERLGWEVVAVHEDNDISAYSGKPRPGYRRLIEDLTSGRADAVLAWHPDRLHRRPVELEGFMEVIEKAGAAVATVQAGELDLSTPSGRLMARQLGSFARYESEHKAERVRRALAQRRQAGKPHGGPRIYGYDGVAIVPEEAEHIRWAAARLGDGVAWNQVVRELNQRGSVTTAGKPWDRRSLKRTLSSPRLRGKLEYQRHVIADGGWPSILSESEWARLRTRMQPGDQSSPRVTSLLAGILRCGACGQGLVHGPGRQRPRPSAPLYWCHPAPGGPRRGCGRVSIQEHLADSTVSAILLEAIGTPQLTVFDLESSRRIEDDLAALRERQQELARDIATGRITLAVGRQADSQLAAEIAECERRLADVVAGERISRLSRAQVAETWEGLSVSERRSFITDAIERVVVRQVGRGWRGPVLDRLEVVWRV